MTGHLYIYIAIAKYSSHSVLELSSHPNVTTTVTGIHEVMNQSQLAIPLFRTSMNVFRTARLEGVIIKGDQVIHCLPILNFNI